LQKHAKGKSDATIDGFLKAIRRYEEYTRFKDFSTFNKDQAIAYKEYLKRQTNERTGKLLTKATLLTELNNLRAFFEWLAVHPEYRRKLDVSAISYLNLSENDKRTAKASKAVKFPTLNQIRKVLESMPETNDIERRDRALVAFTILTGARVNSLITLQLKHIDIHNEHVQQDPNEVHTKFGKLIDTFFFPVGEDIKQIVIDWIIFLQKEKLYGYDAPLFPSTDVALDSNDGFTAIGLKPEHWKSTAPIRRIFEQAFAHADLPYYHPHTFRHTLGHLAYEFNLDGKQLKAWSQNLGHENINTTLGSYGTLSPYRQGQVIKKISQKSAFTPEALQKLMKLAEHAGL
jgi:integrase